MSKWGVTLPRMPTSVRGWAVNPYRPATRGWGVAQGAVDRFTDPNPGQYRSRVGMNAPSTLASMQTLTSLGINWLRADFSWPTIQPISADEFSWATHDAIVNAAAQSGMNILAILDYCAPWASSQGSQGGDIRFYAPTDCSDYANFAAAVVSRYGPGGTFWSGYPESAVIKPITAVELGNEPWGWWFWLPQPDPAVYAAMALAAAQAVKAVNNQVRVVIPGDLYQARSDGLNQQPWASAVFTAQTTLKNFTDVISVHPYPSSVCPDPLDDTHNPDQTWAGKVLMARDMVTATTGTLFPIWITECGWTTATSSTGGVTEAEAATCMNHMLGRALQMNGTATSYKPAVEMVFPFKYDVSNGNLSDSQGNYGMLHSDGTPKPAWAEVLKYL